MFDTKQLKSVSGKMWRMIDTARHLSGIQKKDLAEIAGVHYNTVTNDSKHPEQIPIWRLCIYCDAVGIEPDTIADSLCAQITQIAMNQGG